MMPKLKYKTRIDQIEQLTPDEQLKLAPVAEKYAFRTNDYYLSLIDWTDPEDPIRRIAIPNAEELDDWGRLDASNEEAYTVVPGMEHKYQFTALLLVNDVCGSFCRFCFRKRLFMNQNDEVVRDVSQGIEYIRNHEELNNVLLTGGDPLLLSTGKLEKIISQLREIDHVQIIRIGSKMMAFNPFRISEDPKLLEMLSRYSTAEKKIYMMCHFNHPRELTPEAIHACNLLQKAGVITVNQTPLLRGVNDRPEVLGELFNKLSYIGVPPYYVFQGRPTLGNRMFSIPVEEAFEIFERARMHCSGLAKRARFVMSHATGKIEIVGKTDEFVIMRFHRSAHWGQKSRLLVFKSNPEAYWFDDYKQAVDEYNLVQENCTPAI